MSEALKAATREAGDLVEGSQNVVPMPLRSKS